MWVLIILFLIVCYFIGKNENEKKAKGQQTQGQVKTSAAQKKGASIQAQAKSGATQKKRNRKYDAETKRLYKEVISSYEKYVKKDYPYRSAAECKTVKTWKKMIKNKVKFIKEMKEKL